MALTPGRKIGPYEILAPLGAGGMGEVYRARDERLSREVAIKILPASFAADPDRLKRFEQEARSTGQLNHPNILAVYDTGTHDGIPYVVAELLEGETLRERLAVGPLAVRKALDHASQLGHGLAAAHQKGIVHRDLKPENVFITTDGRVKILDFGLSKLLPPEDAQSLRSETPTRAATEAGVVLGTIGYMSPEQVRGQPADHRSDIFSFGSILYEMVTGARAFHAGSSVETMHAILKEEPPEISRVDQHVPIGLDRIIQHCLEKSPDERFQSARDLAFQIDALTAPSSTGATTPVVKRVRASYARPALAVLVLAGVFAIGVVSARWMQRSPEEATYSQLTFRKGSLSSARFTPDGGNVIYAAAWDGAPGEVFSTRPGSPESRPLGVTRAEVASISSTGEMALLLDPHFTVGFQRTGTLARAPLAGGVPRPMMENVQDADWAPDGSGLAVVRIVDARYRLEYPDGKVLYTSNAWISGPRFSRDGKRIALIDHPLAGDSRGRVVVTDLAGSMKPLTDYFSSLAGLAWSPSGEEIWFTAGKTGNVGALYAVNLSGRQRLVDGAPASLLLQDVSPRGEVLLTRDEAHRGIIGLAPGDTAERDLSWLDWSRPSALSADGTWLLFEEQGQGGGASYSVYLRKTDGSPAVKLGEGYSLAMSPDGQWVATAPVDDPKRLVLVPRGAGTPRPIRSNVELFNVAWLRDGGRLILHGAEAGGLKRLYTFDLGGGSAPRPFTPEGVRGFVVSPDSRSVAAAFEDGTAKIIPVDGGDGRRVEGVGQDDILSFSSDGRSLFVADTRKLPATVDRLDLGTGSRMRWKELMPAEKAGLVDVGWIRLSEDARSYVYSYRRFVSTLYLAQGLH